MARSISLIALSCLVPFAVLLTSPTFITGAGGTGKIPLDLPAGGHRPEIDTGPIPETILLCGQEFEGNSYYFCIARDTSMAVHCAYEMIKQDLQMAIRSLSQSASFNVVTYASDASRWSLRPKLASGSAKEAACAWLDGATLEGPNEIAIGIVETLATANTRPGPNPQIIVVSRGSIHCPSSLYSAVSHANSQAIPIHTIYLGTNAQAGQLMRDLAAQNQGTFTAVQGLAGGD